jgi:hypothetical protein
MGCFIFGTHRDIGHIESIYVSYVPMSLCVPKNLCILCPYVFQKIYVSYVPMCSKKSMYPMSLCVPKNLCILCPYVFQKIYVSYVSYVPRCSKNRSISHQIRNQLFHFFQFILHPHHQFLNIMRIRF